MDLSLTSLEDGLRKPFDLQDVKLLPKSPIKKENTWMCLALPYSDKRAYEDRLNELAFGQWSTPPSLPLVAGNKLVIAATVVLCGVAHTDYGEAHLTSRSRSGDIREEENSATEAYSQAFRRACAQFRLGRYYYNLPKLWVPYDPQKHTIVLDEAKKRTLIEQLYREAGLLPGGQATIHSISPVKNTSSYTTTTASTEETVTAQQRASIAELCQRLSKPVPAVSSSQAANTLFHQLTEEYIAQEKELKKSAKRMQESERSTEEIPDDIKDRLNSLYLRVKALRLCSDGPTFLKHASTVLHIQRLNTKMLTQVHLDLIEKDLIEREQQPVTTR